MLAGGVLREFCVFCSFRDTHNSQAFDALEKCVYCKNNLSLGLFYAYDIKYHPRPQGFFAFTSPSPLISSKKPGDEGDEVHCSKNPQLSRFHSNRKNIFFKMQATSKINYRRIQLFLTRKN